jgi:hypothetical protein
LEPQISPDGKLILCDYFDAGGTDALAHGRHFI